MDIVKRGWFPLAEAARRLPLTRNKPVHISTLVRWIQRGVRGVKLEAIRLGGRWYTSSDAIDTFIGTSPARRSSRRSQANPRAMRTRTASLSRAGTRCIRTVRHLNSTQQERTMLETYHDPGRCPQAPLPFPPPVGTVGRRASVHVLSVQTQGEEKRQDFVEC